MSKINALCVFDCYKDSDKIPNFERSENIELTTLSKEDCKIIRSGGAGVINRWISENIINNICVIVLIGCDTSENTLVHKVIKQAWLSNRALLGISLLCPSKNNKEHKIKNPFKDFQFKGIELSNIVKCYQLPKINSQKYLNDNIENWIKEAIRIRLQN